jgi:hypothetical protein
MVLAQLQAHTSKTFLFGMRDVVVTALLSSGASEWGFANCKPRAEPHKR